MKELVCTFLGNRNATNDIMPQLYDNIEQIIKKGYNVFYIGNHGNFDAMVSKTLQQLKGRYDIKVYIVLAYMPKSSTIKHKHDTILPTGIEDVLPKFAIIYRNKWMIENSNIVITYVRDKFGGAAKFKEYAKSKNKTIIELYK